MTPERWRRIDQLLDATFALPPEKRAAFLDDACAEDQELRQEVEALLASDDRARSFLEAAPMKPAAESPKQKEHSLRPGQSVGPYTIVSLIASGGMGEVYRASDPRIGRDVAIKLLPVHFLNDEGRLSRFEQEARAAGMLNHPNILAIFDVGNQDGTPYLVTELLEGETLREVMRSHSIPLNKAIDFALQIVKALSFAHAKGIIHRDLKPENLFIMKDDRVKLLDFGLAKLMEPQVADAGIATRPASHHTETGVILGTLVYMSPEQIRGEKVDHRSDIFAFGSILYELLSNRRPFEGESQLEVIHAILKSKPAPLALLNLQAAGLEKIVFRCLEKSPDDRFQSTSDLAFALESHVSKSGATSLQRKQWKIYGALILVFLAILGIVVFSNSRRFISNRPQAQQPEPFRKMQIARLTTTEKIAQAAISGDGKYVAYIVKEGDAQSLWVRQAAFSSNLMIVPPSTNRFLNLAFSKDGNFIYYVTCPRDIPSGTAYQVPVLGGSPRKLVDDVYSGISMSPDNRIAVIGASGLMISDVDGHHPQIIVKPSAGVAYEAAPAWAPDGKTIAMVLQSPSTYRARLIAIDVTSGQQTAITPVTWFDIQQLGWLSDGSGLVLVAKEAASGYHTYQIWNVAYPSGRVSRISNDLNDYRGISLTADSNTLVTVRLEQRSAIWTLSNFNAEAKRITHEEASLDGLWGISWTADRRIIYTSLASGNEDLWIISKDGKNKQQLTFGEISKIAPSYCGDGRYAVFMSRSAGGTHIWRIGIDGSGQQKLTNGVSEGIPACSPDGRWIIYVTPGAEDWKLWKIPIDGGKPVQLTDRPSLSPAVSPDSKWVAYAYLDDRHNKNIAIIPVQGGLPARKLPLPSTVLVDIGVGLRWTADGKAIAYIDAKNGVSNLWAQPLDGSSPRQITNFKSGEIFSFDISSHGEIGVTRGNLMSDAVMIRDFR